eukprot:5550294-Pyramimonas_sp.AAC.1
MSTTMVEHRCYYCQYSNTARAILGYHDCTTTDAVLHYDYFNVTTTAIHTAVPSLQAIVEHCPYEYYIRVLLLQCHYCSTTARLPTLAQRPSYNTAAKALHLEATTIVLACYSGALPLFQYYRTATKTAIGT